MQGCSFNEKTVGTDYWISLFSVSLMLVDYIISNIYFNY